MKILMTEESLQLLMKTIEVMEYQPDYFESDDTMYNWSPDTNIDFSISISAIEEIKPKLIINGNLHSDYENKAFELIIYAQKNGFNIDFDFPQKYKESTVYIQNIFLEEEKKGKFTKDEINSIKVGWELMGMSMYMLMKQHDLIDINLKTKLQSLNTFDFYQSL